MELKKNVKFKTNSEIVRNMSDEKLAMILMCPDVVDEGFNKLRSCEETNKNCYKCTLGWLKKEVN